MNFLVQAVDSFKEEFPVSAELSFIYDSLNLGKIIFEKMNTSLDLMEYRSALEELPEHKRVLLPFGYLNSGGGHSMYLELEKVDGTFLIRNYNLGKGVDKYHKKLYMPHQQRSYYIPFVEARDITIDQLCDSNFVDGYLEVVSHGFQDDSRRVYGRGGDFSDRHNGYNVDQYFALFNYLAKHSPTQQVYIGDDNVSILILNILEIVLGHR